MHDCPFFDFLNLDHSQTVSLVSSPTAGRCRPLFDLTFSVKRRAAPYATSALTAHYNFGLFVITFPRHLHVYLKALRYHVSFALFRVLYFALISPFSLLLVYL